MPLSDAFGTEQHGAENFRNFFSYLQGRPGAPTRPLVRLSDCDAFVKLTGLMYVAADRIVTVCRIVQEGRRMRNHDVDAPS